jgi:hypothetical protein
VKPCRGREERRPEEGSSTRAPEKGNCNKRKPAKAQLQDTHQNERDVWSLHWSDDGTRGVGRVSESAKHSARGELRRTKEADGRLMERKPMGGGGGSEPMYLNGERLGLRGVNGAATLHLTYSLRKPATP